jgi:high-affinity iron transporter
LFDVGAFAGGLVTGLREGVEAALIVAIVCACLARTGNARHFGKIAAGVGVAVAVSLGLGAAIFATIGTLEAPYEQILDGVAMLLAAGVVTWMLFWMRRQARSIQGDLQRAVDRVLSEGSAWSLGVLAFTAVIREGVETAIFLVGQATAAAGGEAGGGGSVSVLGGALAGLAIAAVLGYGFYRGSRVLDLPLFFRRTGILLVFMAAGLVSHAVHDFVEIGWITVGAATAFDVGAILPHDQGPGLLLRAVFGYTSTPEWATLGTWAAYVAAVLSLYLRPMRRHPAAAPAEPRETAASGT